MPTVMPRRWVRVFSRARVLGILFRIGRMSAFAWGRAGEVFRFTNRQSEFDDLGRNISRIITRNQCPCMTRSQLACFNHGENTRGKCQEPQSVCDMTAALSN